ncbi:MAG: septum formation initiator family protein [Anaerolineae bacterium]|nr:septum formation initiator family protein [Anaerolineae bacterium]
MIGKEVRRTPLVSQLVLILMGTVLLYLVVNFGRQVATSYQRGQELQQIQEKVRLAEERNQDLHVHLGYAQSDQAAEAWAREQGWAKTGEVPVIVVAPSAKESPELEPSQQELPASYRQAWWELFFGTR